MSFEALAWAKRVQAGSPNRKLVLMLLAEYADEDGSCFPSQRRIAGETELGERTVRRILADLEGAGLLRREHRGRAGNRGGRTSDRIYLSIQTANLAGNASHVVPSNGHSVDSTGQPCDSNGQALAGEPLVEPPVLEPSPAAPDAAQLILNGWWEAQTPRPQQPYIAALKVCRKALKDGWQESELREALDDMPVISGGALQFWRKTRGSSRPRSAAALDRVVAQLKSEEASA